MRELLARLERGEGVKPIARELGVDRKTVKRWRQVGQWRRQLRRRARQIDPFIPFLEQRGPEVGWNCAVLHRELRALGYRAGVLQVQRYVQPWRAARRRAAVAAQARPVAGRARCDAQLAVEIAAIRASTRSCGRAGGA